MTRTLADYTVHDAGISAALRHLAEVVQAEGFSTTPPMLLEEAAKTIDRLLAVQSSQPKEPDNNGYHRRLQPDRNVADLAAGELRGAGVSADDRQASLGCVRAEAGSVSAVPSSSQQEIAAVKKEEKNDLGAHVCHGGRSDLEPAARPELSHAARIKAAREAVRQAVDDYIEGGFSASIIEHNIDNLIVACLGENVGRTPVTAFSGIPIETRDDFPRDAIAFERHGRFVGGITQIGSGEVVAGEASPDSAQERSAQVIDAPRDPLSGGD